MKGRKMAKTAKNKTHKGTKKRIKVSATGKLMKKRAFGSHLLTKKSANRKRKIRKPLVVSASDTAKLRDLLGL
jgi:large subunit ribosomal protein L35